MRGVAHERGLPLPHREALGERAAAGGMRDANSKVIHAEESP